MNTKTLLTPLLLAAAAATRADLIVNGGFTGADGGPSAEGWTTVGEVEPNAYYGPNCVRGGTSNGLDARLGQTLSLQTGAGYRLTFDAFSTQGVGSNHGIDVWLGSSLLFSNRGGLASAWTPFAVDFTAMSERDLSFTLMDGNSTVSLTRVDLQAVPEPGTLVVFGVAGIGLLRRKRRVAGTTSPA